MNISAVSSVASAETSFDASSLGIGPDDFLVLLIAELQSQDPMDPMDNATFMAQLSQMQVVAETRQMRQSQEVSQALAMVGRQVHWQDPDTGDYYYGVVDGVVTEGSEPLVLVGDKQLKLGQILAITQVVASSGEGADTAAAGSAVF